MEMTIKTLKDKKGLERSMLVTLIIGIITLAIIIWYFAVFKPYSGVDKEACRLSIIVRSMPVAGNPLKGIEPLQCKTEQIEIDNKYRTEEQIKKKVADALAECWSMVGKGELNFMPKGFWSEDYCMICSSIEFDKNAKKNFPVVSGLLSYMNNSKISGEQSYYNYIFNDNLKVNADVDIDSSQDYVILFTLNKEGWLKQNQGYITTALIAGGVIIATIATGGAAAPVIGTISVATTATATTTTITFVESAAVAGGTAIISGVSGWVIKGALGKIALNYFVDTAVGEAGLHLIPYEGKEIQKYCSRFENAP